MANGNGRNGKHRKRGRGTRNPTPIDAEVGARIKQARLAAGLSQTKLGDRIGVTFQQVQKYETGANRVGASRLYKIARVTGKPVAWFFSHVRGANGVRGRPRLDPMQIFASSKPGQALAPHFITFDPGLQRALATLTAHMRRRPRLAVRTRA
jgi:transcriptional regulator with XRE-family HTH domain